MAHKNKIITKIRVKALLAVSTALFVFPAYGQNYQPPQNYYPAPQNPAPQYPVYNAPQFAPQPQQLPVVTSRPINNPTAQNVENEFVAKFTDPAQLPQAVRQKPTTMEDLLSYAYITNPSLNSARAAMKSVDEGVYQGNAGWLPSASYSMGRDKSKRSIDNGPSSTIYPNSDTLSVRENLFTGGNTYYSTKAAEARVLSARSELKKTEQDFLLEAITGYIQYIYTQKVLKLAENNEAVLREQLKATQDRFVVGDATKTDVAQSEARLAVARSNRVLSNGDFINARADFKRIFGKEATGTLPMPTKLPNVPATLDEAMKTAFLGNPQVTQLQHLIDANDNDIDVQRSALLPQVSLDGSTGNSHTSDGFGGLEKIDDTTVGVNVTIPLYNKGIEYSRMRQARDVKTQTSQEYNNTKNAVKSAVIEAWEQLSTTATNIDATKASLVASQFALEGVREEQKEGARTVLDVLDAEQERFSAETGHARAIKDGLLAVYKLKSVLGQLSPEELNLSTPEYNPEEHYKNTRFKFIGL